MRSLLFIDDHPIYRDGLSKALVASMHNLDIAVVDGCAAAIALIERSPTYDLCLADQRLKDGEGAVLIGLIKARCPLMAVGLLCAEPSASLAERVRRIGAVACLSKDRDTDGLVEALETLFAGGTVFDDFPSGQKDFSAFSLRRREILALAAQGLIDKQIADRLGVTESTIRNHWQHMFVRLGATNRTEAVGKAIRNGLI